MSLNITNNKRNELLARQEIKAVFSSAQTPKFEDVQKAIAAAISKPEELVIVNRIKGVYGASEFNIEANVYDSKENADKIEPKKKAKKSAQA